MYLFFFFHGSILTEGLPIGCIFTDYFRNENANHNCFIDLAFVVGVCLGADDHGRIHCDLQAYCH